MFSQEKYLKALRFATKIHGEQKTSHGLPYIAHLCSVVIEVMYACQKSKIEDEKTDKAITIAFLSATMENTSMAYDDIYKQFTPEIAQGVEALTKDKTLKTKKEQVEDGISRLLTQDYEIQMIKLANAIVNMQKPPKQFSNIEILEYHREAKFIYSCFKNSNIYLAKRLEEKINAYEIYLK